MSLFDKVKEVVEKSKEKLDEHCDEYIQRKMEERGWRRELSDDPDPNEDL